MERLAGIRPGATPATEYLDLARRLPEDPDAPTLHYLSTYTNRFLDPYLRVEFSRHRIRAGAVARGGFGQLEAYLLQDAVPPVSAGDLVLLHILPEDVAPDRYVRFHASDGEGLASLLDEIHDRLIGCVHLVRERGGEGPILVGNFPLPHVRPHGVLDAAVPGSLTHRLNEANARLAEALHPIAGATVWDYAGLVARCGAREWSDPRMKALARYPVAQAMAPFLAEHLARSVSAVVHPRAKCLVLDLDYTLWGGAVGDVGMSGLQLGDDHPGVAFKALQRAALSLRDRGILLAVVSKNHEEVALEAMREHPEMLLRPDDLSAYRINWRPKSENLQELSEELNLGMDAMVFFDDNPVERHEVAVNAPDVVVLDVPDDPVGFAEALLDSGQFDVGALTAEDRSRAVSYAQDKTRKAVRAQSLSAGDYLASLSMVATYGRVDPGSLNRAVQLIQKTNQYNLTTRRHSFAQVEALSSDPAARVVWLRLEDRFGQLGIVAVGIVRTDGTDAEIDTFVVSCRVANRGVEQALAHLLCREARELGARTLQAEYVPSGRNTPVATMLPELGFEPLDGRTADTYEHRLDTIVPWPSAIRLAEKAETATAPDSEGTEPPSGAERR